MKFILALFALACCTISNGQRTTKRVLFLGNSYTGVNNLPKMVADVTNSTGDSLIYGTNTPGGYTFKLHSTNATSLAKIALGNWDFVVLQEQSQHPSFPTSQVETDVFPYARFLDSLINAKNACAETVFYMTWGRKNGDASNCVSWPPVCTYAGMDDLLNVRYRMMADSNNAILSPVGAVWRYLRENYPSIELYQNDGSHPSVAGSYVAACCFYTVLFRNDPTTITFNSFLSITDAETIRTATKLIVYDSLLNWNVGAYDPLAKFTYNISNDNQVSFTNSSLNASNYTWDFGDGVTSANNNPIHNYFSTGTFTVQLIASKCGISDSTYQNIQITKPLDEKETILYPNPVTHTLHVKHNFSHNIIFKIVSISGQEIKTGIINNSETQINVSFLSNGIYFLQCFDNNKMLGFHKFVKCAE